MNERDALHDVAATIDECAVRLADLSERLYARLGELSEGTDADDEVWMRDARKALHQVVREIEGDSPPPTKFPLAERVDAFRTPRAPKGL